MIVTVCYETPSINVISDMMESGAMLTNVIDKAKHEAMMVNALSRALALFISIKFK